jgi:hypothetical protein
MESTARDAMRDVHDAEQRVREAEAAKAAPVEVAVERHRLNAAKERLESARDREASNAEPATT